MPLFNRDPKDGAVLDVVVVLYKPGELERRLLREVSAKTEVPHTFRVFDNSENEKNLSMAWNDMANEGHAPYVAFLHSDLVLSKGWESPLIHCLESDPSVGAALPNPARFDQIGRSFPLSDPPTDVQMEAWASWSRKAMVGKTLTFAVPHECAVFFCTVVRRKDFIALKGFDERFRFVGNNHEFQWRLRDMKFRTVMVHSSSVWHKDALSFRKAVDSGLFREDLEGEHWSKWKDLLLSGTEKKWHELGNVVRLAVRCDARFMVGGPI